MRRFENYAPRSLDVSRMALAALAVWGAVLCVGVFQKLPFAAATLASAEPIATKGSRELRRMPLSPARPGRAKTVAFSQAAPARVAFSGAASSTVSAAAVAPSESARINPSRMAGTAVAAAPASTTPVSATPVSAGVAAAPPSRFLFADDIGGRLLSEKLIPPAQFAVAPVPFISEPKPRRLLKFDPLPRENPPLVQTSIRQQPLAASLPALSGLSLRALDRPDLPREAALAAPSPIQVFPLSRSYVRSVDPDQVPFLPVSTAPPKERLDAASNPARRSAEDALFQTRLLAASIPTPFLKLAIPEPFEQIRAVRLNSPLPDLNPGLFPAGRPSQPHFPVIEPPQEPKK